MLKIAHRGYTKYHADNSMNAFRDAIKYGFDMIELDIQLDKEDNIIIFHDPFIGTTPVNNMTIQEIRSNYPDVLLLSTFFELFNYKQIRLYFDMKGSEKLAYVLHDFLVKHSIVLDKMWFASFNIRHLNILRKIGFYNLGLISDNIYNTELLDYFIEKCDFQFICFSWTVLHKETVEYLKTKQVSTFTYTLKDVDFLPIVQEYGVHGIVSDILI